MEDNMVRKDDATFNAEEEVKRVRARRAEARRKLYSKSSLDKHRAELVALRKAGASLADLVEWLRKNCRIKIHRSSIGRYLNKLPEMFDTPSNPLLPSGEPEKENNHAEI
jgi:hypothetical protein